jgi:phospholipid transport system substrate-binding protein
MLFVLRLLLILLPQAALAADALPPEALMQRITDEVTAAIRHDPHFKPAALAEAKMLPHFNARRATQLAMGSNWRRATPQEQDRLVAEFTKLLIRTYSGALAGYRDQTIDYRPTRLRPEDTEATVLSFVRQAGVQPIAIEYDMERCAEGWKVYDVRVGGVGLVATYRTSFAEEVRNRGVDGLIGLLSAKNRS